MLSLSRSRTVTMPELNALPDPVSMGRFHRPLRFDELVGTLQEVFEPKALTMGINGTATKIFGRMEFQSDEDITKLVGFRTSTDESMGLKLAIGVHVRICDNGILSGDEYVVDKRNTTRLNLMQTLMETVPHLEGKANRFRTEFDRLRYTELDYNTGCQYIVEAIRKGVVPSQDAKKIADIWHRCHTPESTGRTVGTLINAFTRVVQDAPPMAQFNRTVAIGKLFGV